MVQLTSSDHISWCCIGGHRDACLELRDGKEQPTDCLEAMGIALRSKYVQEEQQVICNNRM